LRASCDDLEAWQHGLEGARELFAEACAAPQGLVLGLTSAQRDQAEGVGVGAKVVLVELCEREA
jgi:hypothetical protein